MSRVENKDMVFLSCAEVLATLSTCDRAKIGAILTYRGRAIAWGYNGAPPGMPHCADNNHGWHETDWPTPGGKSPQEWEDRMLVERGCRNSIHAEVNSIAFAARQGISTEGATCYVSQSPCLGCARLIIAAGIDRVVFAKEYRDRAGLELLERAGVG